MMNESNIDDREFPTLPPAKLLAGNRQQIAAGLQCIDDIEVLKQYLAFENTHQDRTPVQNAIRNRAAEIRAQANC